MEWILESINRNIVECKLIFLCIQTHRYHRINRNIVECKSWFWWWFLSYVWVLIETLWNVNNSIRSSMRFSSFRINRNIVECKFTFGSVERAAAYRINRNIVECKYCSTFALLYLWSVLIETLWNVNIDPDSVTPPAWSINRNIVECKYLCEELKKLFAGQY